MGDGHLCKTAHEQEGDDAADGVADEDGRTGEGDGEAAAEEEAGADGAANRNHGELRGGELAAEAVLALCDDAEARGVGVRG